MTLDLHLIGRCFFLMPERELKKMLLSTCHTVVLKHTYIYSSCMRYNNMSLVLSYLCYEFKWWIMPWLVKICIGNTLVIFWSSNNFHIPLLKSSYTCIFVINLKIFSFRSYKIMCLLIKLYFVWMILLSFWALQLILK